MGPLPIVVWLQAQPQDAPLWADPLFMMVAIFAIFYLLLIRPQSKQRKEHEEMLKTVTKDDEVVTSGGIHGKVTGETDDVLTVEIANVKGERVRIKVDRRSIERRTSRAGGDES